MCMVFCGCDEGVNSPTCAGEDCDLGDDSNDAAPGPDTAPAAEDMGLAMDVTVPASVTVSPSLFEFPFVPMGRQYESSIRIRNSGQASIVLDRFASAFGSDYALFWKRGDGDIPLDQQNAGVVGGMNQMPESIELDGGDVLVLTLLYSPTETGQRGGHFLFWTDGEIRLPIEHSDERPRFSPDSDTVEFEDTLVGERKVKLLRIANVGTAIANLESVQIEGDDVFSITIEGRDPSVDNRVLYNPDRDPEPGVGIDKAFEILIRFLADEPGDYLANITVISDAENDVLVVPISARALADDSE